MVAGEERHVRSEALGKEPFLEARQRTHSTMPVRPIGCDAFSSAQKESKIELKGLTGVEKDEQEESIKGEAEEEDEGNNGLSQDGLRAKERLVQDDEEATDEVRSARMNPEVHKPSKEEKEHHERTHCPYRVWCKHCVRGRGMNSQHRKKKDKQLNCPGLASLLQLEIRHHILRLWPTGIQSKRGNS